MIALRTTIFTLLLTGIAYPLATTAVAQLLFPKQAAGDLSLIAQPVTNPAYLWPRPSAVSYEGSGGSNRAVKAPFADELHTASASGLDPHISPEAALQQAARIARARGIAEERVRTLLEKHVEGRDLGVLGEPRLNVLLTNLALDRQFGAP